MGTKGIACIYYYGFICLNGDLLALIEDILKPDRGRKKKTHRENVNVKWLSMACNILINRLQAQRWNAVNGDKMEMRARVIVNDVT